MDGLSLVSDVGSYSSSCGYCKSEEEGSRAHGMIAERISAHQYQDLIDRGWRRSGTFLYKPDLSSSCCCLYTIRLDTTAFKPSKSQRKLLRRWQLFLAGERGMPDVQGQSEGRSEDSHMNEISEPTDEDMKRNELEGSLAQTINHCISSGSIRISDGTSADLSKPRVLSLNPQQQRVLGAGFCFTSPTAFSIAKALEDKSTPDLATEAQKVAELISSEFNAAHSSSRPPFTASSLKGHINFKSHLPRVSSAHQTKGSKEDSQPRPPARPHRFEMKMVPAAFDQASFDLYHKYQVSQHGDKPDEVTHSGYRRFLVDSPLFDESHERGDVVYGSFHQQYWLDDKLIAVGVVDVLPRCLSSVYLFWDPDLAALGLGKLTALLEIQWVQGLNNRRLCYYYMGFFIPTCPKMTYKADYEPSDLLSPLSQAWVRLSPQIRSLLDSLERPYLELSDVSDVVTFPNLSFQPSQAQDPESLDNVIICVNSDTFLSWGDLKSRLRKKKQVEEIEQQLSVWKRKIGKDINLCYSI